MIDYLSQHLWQTWAVIAVICLILELTAGDFFIMCFSIGAVFASVARVWRQLWDSVSTPSWCSSLSLR